MAAAEMVACSNCKTRVFPKADGRCPSCGFSMEGPCNAAGFQIAQQQAAAADSSVSTSFERSRTKYDNRLDARDGLEYVDVTWARVLMIWWGWAWRAFPIAVALGFVLGFLGGLVVELVGHAELGRAIGGTLGGIAGFLVSLCTLRVVLRTRFSGFRIRLVKA